MLSANDRNLSNPCLYGKNPRPRLKASLPACGRCKTSYGIAKAVAVISNNRIRLLAGKRSARSSRFPRSWMRSSPATSSRTSRFQYSRDQRLASTSEPLRKGSRNPPSFSRSPSPAGEEVHKQTVTRTMKESVSGVTDRRGKIVNWAPGIITGAYRFGRRGFRLRFWIPQRANSSRMRRLRGT